MNTRLNMPGTAYRELMAHLLSNGSWREQAAFLFAEVVLSKDEARFDVIETRKLSGDDFAVQEGDYIELSDSARAEVIKRAHDLAASLIEIHSHLGPWPAAFSIADRAGLRETVPHMWWRLDKKPYIALVVTNTEFDALVWLDNATVPRPLEGWNVGERTLIPTSNSLGGWQ